MAVHWQNTLKNNMIQIIWSDGVETKLRPYKEVPLEGEDDRAQSIPLCVSKHMYGWHNSLSVTTAVCPSSTKNVLLAKLSCNYHYWYSDG